METLKTEFYKALAKLFYSIAAADKKVHAEEYHTLKHVLETKWTTNKTIAATSCKDVEHILTAFKSLNNQKCTNTNVYLEDFFNFKNNNEILFTKPLKQLMYSTALAIANSFAKKNKSELIMLAKLELELNEK